MNKTIFSLIICVVFTCVFAQEKTWDTNTESVQKQRAMGYPLSVLEELPVVKGCEALASNKVYSAKCMKDQFNFLFAPFMKGIEKETKLNEVSIYIEFIIEKDGSISMIERLKLNDRSLDEFVRNAFVQFRRKIIQEKIIVKPGRIYDRDVSTLYGVKFYKVYKK
ncbi:MAG: hypothetical protein Q4G27_11020 [Flavobacteriaceae bacterium]|nr:hypothetical protein [Flavobacteriaceae bacterium]